MPKIKNKTDMDKLEEINPEYPTSFQEKIYRFEKFNI